MSKFDTFKNVTTAVVGHSAGFATTRAIIANAPTNGSLYERACVVIGAIAVGTMVGSKTADFTGDQFDAVKKGIDSAKEENANQ